MTVATPPAPAPGPRAPHPRAGRPERLHPARAVAGAAVAVAGVLLGIGSLLWATSSAVPQGDPTVRPAAGPQPTADAPDPSAAGGSAPALDLPATDAATPDAPPQSPAASAASAAPVREPVLVINNSRIHDLAQRAASRFSAAGWPVKGIDSVSGRIRQTTVYYLPGQEEQARAFAAQFGISRVLPRLPQLPGTGLTVVVTRDYAP